MVSRHEANSREDAVTELRMLLENNIIRHGTGIMCLLELKYKFCVYSGPSLKGHSLERTPLYKGHKFLAASTMNVHNAPSHQRTPL